MRKPLIEAVITNKRLLYGQDIRIKKIKSFGVDTIALLLQRFPNAEGFLPFFTERVISYSEVDIRELLIYGECVAGTRAKDIVFKEVRESLGLSDLSLAPEGSKLREGIHAALRVSVASRERWWRLDNARGLPYRERLDPDQMTAPLAEFILEHLDSVDDIITYVTDREREPRDVDINDLREYLNHIAPAMREGML